MATETAPRLVTSRYMQADDPGVRTPGADCANCGRPGFAHETEKVRTDDGRWRYKLVCPDG